MDLPGLSFRPGLGIGSVVRQRFGLLVSPASSAHRPFFLVASFGRCKFRLCPISVGLILQATIGGSAPAFDVVQLADRVFRFSVAAKQVGFHIFKLNSFSCSGYKVFFNLWSNGGPRWEFEFAEFCKEEDISWSKIRRNSSSKQSSSAAAAQRSTCQRSFADAVKFGPLTGANRIPLRVSAFDRLQFPNHSGQINASAQLKDRSVHAKFHSGSGQKRGSRDNNGGSSNLNLSLRQPPGTQYLSKGKVPGICSRCLSDKHPRRACMNPIKCLACMRWGHIAVNCIAACYKRNALQEPSLCNKGKDDLAQPRWFSKNARVAFGPGSSSPPRFSSFTDWWKYSLMLQHSTNPPEPLLVPWKLPNNSMTVGHNEAKTHNTEKHVDVSTNLTLGILFPSRETSSATPSRTSVDTMLQENDENPIPAYVQTQEQPEFDFFGLGQNILDQQEEPPQQQI